MPLLQHPVNAAQRVRSRSFSVVASRVPANRFVAVALLEHRSRRQWIALWTILGVIVCWWAARGIASVVFDRWWYDTVTDAAVWNTRVIAQAQLLFGTALIVAAVLGTSVWLVLRLGAVQTEPPNQVIVRYHQRMGPAHRWLLIGLVAYFTYRIGTAATDQWQNWLLFRNSKDLGTSAPVVGGDLGFHLFRLPFLTAATSFLRQLLLFTLAIAAFGHVMSGAIRLPKNAPAASRVANAHLAMLLAGFLAVQAFHDVAVARPSMATDRRGAFDGPGWTDLHVLKPGLVVCAVVTVAAGFAAVWSARSGRWRPLFIGLSTALVVQLAVVIVIPAATQRLVVAPAEAERQLWAIDDNLEATRQAYGLDVISESPLDEPDTALVGVEDAADVILFDTSTMASALQVMAGTTGTRIIDTDIITPHSDGVGSGEPVFIAPRSASRSDLPEQGWVQQNLVFTHGDGVVAVPATSLDPDGRPDVSATEPSVAGFDRFASTPLYFDQSLANWYAIVGTNRTEVGDTTFAGEGIAVGTFGNRLVAALALSEPQILLSSELTSESALVYRRSLLERVGAIAPFLSLDSDPYLVPDGDRLVWVIEGYTTSSTFPAAQFVSTASLPARSGLQGTSVNAIRASVRATVDAQTGETHLYRTDGGTDPIIDVWDDVFPGLLEDASSIPSTIAAELRYPGDLWSIQSALVGRYHVDSPEDLFSGAQRWAVSAAPPSVVGDTDVVRSAPVDQFGSGDDLFGSSVPYGPGSASNPTSTRDELSAVAIADHGPSEKIHLATTSDATVLSPRVAQSAIDSDPEMARAITLLNANGSTVRYGPMAPLVDGDNVVWVRPILVIGPGSSAVPRLYGVAAVRDGLVAVESTSDVAVRAVLSESDE